MNIINQHYSMSANYKSVYTRAVRRCKSAKLKRAVRCERDVHELVRGRVDNGRRHHRSGQGSNRRCVLTVAVVNDQQVTVVFRIES